MEKLLVVLAAMLMLVGLSTAGFASGQNVIGYAYLSDTSAYLAAADRGGTAPNQGMCGPGEMYTGAIAWVDPDVHKMMVSGQDGDKIFDVSGAVMNVTPEDGRWVSVNYTDSDGQKVASAVNMVPVRVAFLYGEHWF